MDLKTLKFRWVWTSVGALIMIGVLGWVGAPLDAAGYGILDLEFARNAADVSTIVGAWSSAAVLGAAGWLLVLDYIFMPLYGLALFHGTRAARESFAPLPGRLYRILTVAAALPLVAAGLDAIENLLEARMIFGGLTPDISGLAFAISVTKFILIAVGLAGSIAGIAGWLKGRLRSV
jgi:hypothetical protein